MTDNPTDDERETNVVELVPMPEASEDADPHLIAALESVMAEARAGEIAGACIVTWRVRRKEGRHAVEWISSGVVKQSPMLELGALAMIRHEIATKHFESARDGTDDAM